MKKMLFKRIVDPQKRSKKFSIDSDFEDAECKTRVQKSFMYIVDRAKEKRPSTKPPLVFIHKFFDTKKGIEQFSFHVKGFFFVTHGRELIKVRFCHTLDIRIQWKIKNDVPNKSATLK